MEAGSQGDEDSRKTRDEERIQKILQSMGVKHFDPNIIAMLQEMMICHSIDVLQEALVVRDHAKRKDLTVEDVNLAIKFKIEIGGQFSQRPARKILEELATAKNSIEMPDMNQKKTGIILPQERFCLNAPNYQVIPRQPDPKAGAQANVQQQGQMNAAKAGKTKKRKFGVISQQQISFDLGKKIEWLGKAQSGAQGGSQGVPERGQGPLAV